jgi:hypothetical protein
VKLAVVTPVFSIHPTEAVIAVVYLRTNPLVLVGLFYAKTSVDVGIPGTLWKTTIVSATQASTVKAYSAI